MSDFYGNITESRWYIIQTYSGYEKKVIESLKERIKSYGISPEQLDEKDILIPEVERVQIDKEGKQKKKMKKLFPGYVLIKMILDEETWYCVRHTPGVSGFVGSGNHPIPLTNKEASDILNKIAPQEKPKVEITLGIGEMVQAKTGAFAGRPGPVVSIDAAKAKVKFSIEFFGREMEVEADYSDLERL